MRDSQYYKIGISKDVNSRLSSIQTGNPRTVEYIYSTPLGGKALTIEKLLHKHYRRFNTSGEWFLLQEEEVSELIEFLDTLEKKVSPEKPVKQAYVHIDNDYEELIDGTVKAGDIVYYLNIATSMYDTLTIDYLASPPRHNAAGVYERVATSNMHKINLDKTTSITSFLDLYWTNPKVLTKHESTMKEWVRLIKEDISLLPAFFEETRKKHYPELR